MANPHRCLFILAEELDNERDWNLELARPDLRIWRRPSTGTEILCSQVTLRDCSLDTVKDAISPLSEKSFWKYFSKT